MQKKSMLLENKIKNRKKGVDKTIFFVYNNRAVAGVAELADAHV